MLTTCTACSTQFRVTAAQLRTAHGLVRCGHCQTVFDAFETLREESDHAGAPVTPPPSESAPPMMDNSVESLPTLPLMLLEERLLETDGIYIEPAQEKRRPRAEDLFTELEVPANPVDWGTTRLTDDILPESNSPAGDLKPPPDAPLPPVGHLTPLRHSPRATAGWAAGIGLLILLLAVQLLNANRAALSRNLVVGPSLAAVYAALGRPLTQPRALGQWLISNPNVTSDPDTPGALSITGTLTNNAGFAQPWPLLRVELTDRYGDLLRARDFNASEYLPTGQADVWLAAGAATRFRIDVVDPGPDAVGFQVQPCFDFGHTRSCAGDGNKE